MNKTMLAILNVLGNHGNVVGSREISRGLKRYGIDLTERTVRYHLRILDERGYTIVIGREGRKITDKGKEELDKALVADRIGFVISKIESLSYQTTLNLDTMQGMVILNISFFPSDRRSEALDILEPVFRSPFVMNDRVIIADEGTQIGDVIVPEGMTGLGTLCSVTLNGLFLKSGIPVTSRFGGIVEISDSHPTRFTALISYEGTSLDPLEIFIRSSMTDVNGAVHANSGKILASFREIPAVCIGEAQQLAEALTSKGFGGILMVGEPNTPLLEIPVGRDRAGVVVVGGLNPIAAIEERGIATESTAMSALYMYEHLQNVNETLENFA